jgi:HK97 gp10 family phage protein
MNEIEGVKEVIKMLDGVIDEDKIQAKLMECCALVERSAKQKAPKGDGELRRSITSKVEGLEGIVFTPLLYAPYVEYGTGLFAEEGGRKDVPWSYKDEKGEWHSTRGMKPSPFMRPALDENREEIINILRGITK